MATQDIMTKTTGNAAIPKNTSQAERPAWSWNQAADGDGNAAFVFVHAAAATAQIIGRLGENWQKESAGRTSRIRNKKGRLDFSRRPFLCLGGGKSLRRTAEHFER